MNSITLLAPAKVNIFLKILNKRKDGYHNILTIFERISLADEIKISKIHRGIKISSDKPITRYPEDNIVYKAAELVLEYIGSPQKKSYQGVKIKIKKRIPIAAGLGGGSSDAAAVLIGINRLYGLGISQKKLMDMAAKLGADVPFFVLNTRFAVGRAIGDKLTKLPWRIKPWHIIVYPGNYKAATRDIYEEFDRISRGLALRRTQGQIPELAKDLTSKVPNVKIKPSFKHALDISGLEEMLYNSLEDAIIAKFEVIGKLVKRLAYSLGKKAIVSGSGPSVFCLYRTRKEAEGARKKLLAGMKAQEIKSWQVFVASS